MYTASLYGGLVSLLANVPSSELQGKRVGAYSYGSGLASTLFSLQIQGDVSKIVEVCDLKAKLDGRKVLSPVEYESFVALREKAHLSKDFTPSGEVSNLRKGTYYLVKVDENFRREYAVAA